MVSRKRKCWDVSIDVGGTFTDCIATSPGGETSWVKVLSSGATKGRIAEITDDSFKDPDRIEEAPGFWIGYNVALLKHDGTTLAQGAVSGFDSPSGTFVFQFDSDQALRESAARYELTSTESAPLLAIRKITGSRLGESLPDMNVRLGTTQGTNALLTRSGSPTALITTRGFGDVLEIGEQNRPQLFELAVRKHVPLYDDVIEIDERILADGTIRRPPCLEAVRAQLATAYRAGIRSLAICFLHGYKYRDHELLVGQVAREFEFEDVSLSCDVAPQIKIVSRGETTVLDAYLNPVLRSYMRNFSENLTPNSRLRMMTSAGGLVDSQSFSGRNSILSGPAGGVVGFSKIAQQLGFEKSIGFDMGGTSTDVARFGGHFEKSYESMKAGVRVLAPMMAIETVAAGGGSICKFDGSRLLVGPESEGADPGPACYGRGGALCVTDLNVFLGRIVAEQFPFPLDLQAIEVQLSKLQHRVRHESGVDYSLQQLAEGFLQVANINMSSAVRKVSVSRGYDPREHVLVAFGGAASQHVCQVARQLRMRQVLAHPLGGILSAMGISMAVQSINQSAPLDCPLDADNWPAIDQLLTEVAHSASLALNKEIISPAPIAVVGYLDLRYAGTHAPITVSGSSLDDFLQAFESRHKSEFGYLMQRRIDVCAVRAEAVEQAESTDPVPPGAAKTAAKPAGSQRCFLNGEFVETPVYSNSDLSPGQFVLGPAIVDVGLSSVLIESDWKANVLPENILLLEYDRQEPFDRTSDAEHEIDRPDPVRLEVFNNHFSSIAENMGEMLRKTSISVNVRERLDFSCAIFTSTGDLVVNAPHVPVHLGAMGDTVKSTIELNAEVFPEDVFVTNDPFRGGSHLPDITVVTPVFDDRGQQLLFFVASRCHHAEIGGMTVGSMPPNATCLAQEGVLISNFKLVDQGVERYDTLRNLLTTGEYPSRSPDENIIDLMAQVAANQRGVNGLSRLVQQFTLPVVTRYMQFIQDAAEKKTRAALSNLDDLDRRFSDELDCGARIVARICKQNDTLAIDFTGTDLVLNNNLNANKAITMSAVLYCLRCMIHEDIPLNEGILRAVDVVLPQCFINPSPGADPRHQPAVSGGNVETSQRIVDVILGGLQLAAASQGTMNNFLMGDDSFGYYETICGGTGATASRPGASAVHSHMTNTRLTDAEVLESSFPVILEQFSIRKGSGGIGQQSGGDGVIRQFQFLRDLTVTLITNRRTVAPYGLHGGASGEPGKNRLLPADGMEIDIGYQATLQVGPGDKLRIETPGGGGWGVA